METYLTSSAAVIGVLHQHGIEPTSKSYAPERSRVIFTYERTEQLDTVLHEFHNGALRLEPYQTIGAFLGARKVIFAILDGRSVEGQVS